MKNFTKLFALAVVILGFSATSFGQTYSASASANAKAEVKQGISITKPSSGVGSELNFGQLFTDGTAALVTVDKTVVGAQTAGSNNLGCLPVASTASTCKFTLTNGGVSTPFTVDVTSSLTVSNGANNMSVDIVPSITGGTLVGTTDIHVGGVLHVGAAQAVGTYTSATPFTLTIGWN